MQIKCSYCGTPFAISNEEAEIAVRTMTEEKLTFFNTHCPKCRRAIKITKSKLKLHIPFRKLFETDK